VSAGGAGTSLTIASNTARRSVGSRLSLGDRPHTAGPAVAPAGVHNRKVQGVVLGAELNQQIKDLVDHGLNPLVRPVHLVDDDNRLEAGLERLAQHELGLRHRALGGVHQQAAPVRHPQYALDLAAKVGVARGIHDIDAEVGLVQGPVQDRAVLREDRDPPLALEGVAVHDQVVLAALELLELPARKLPDCLSRLSTSVVLPWSTWAMIATLRIRSFRGVVSLWGAWMEGLAVVMEAVVIVGGLW